MNTTLSPNSNRRSVSRTNIADRRRNPYRIGEISRLTGFSVDTLRYYEKINLLSSIHRTTSGIRVYDERDLSRLRFIQKAKSMSFSLEEIARLLDMQEDPQRASDDLRNLTRRKLQAVEERIQALQTFRKELALLINSCGGTDAGPPVIDDQDSQAPRARPKRS